MGVSACCRRGTVTAEGSHTKCGVMRMSSSESSGPSVPWRQVCEADQAQAEQRSCSEGTARHGAQLRPVRSMHVTTRSNSSHQQPILSERTPTKLVLSVPSTVLYIPLYTEDFFSIFKGVHGSLSIGLYCTPSVLVISSISLLHSRYGLYHLLSVTCLY